MSPPPPPPPLPLPLRTNMASATTASSKKDDHVNIHSSSGGNVSNNCNDSSRSSSSSKSKTCYETKCEVGSHEALVEVEKACRFDLEFILSAVEIGDEGGGMVAVVQPLLQPITQNGPVCGLVALVEAGEVLGLKLNPDDVLAKAVEIEVTKKGEMFSCEGMKLLAKEFKIRGTVLNTRDKDTLTQLVSHCLRGKPLLVPYDADRNHSPSLRKGHAAHWATIHGIAMIMPISTMQDLFEVSGDTGNAKVICADSTEAKEKFEILVETFKEDKTYVVAHQGKSYKTALWKLDDLIRSNQNLLEISPKLTQDCDSYKLYDIEEGLCSKILLLDNY